MRLYSFEKNTNTVNYCFERKAIMLFDVIQKIIVDFHKAELPLLTERELDINPIKGMSFTIVGSRRSGKTCRT